MIKKRIASLGLVTVIVMTAVLWGVSFESVVLRILRRLSPQTIQFDDFQLRRWNHFRLQNLRIHHPQLDLTAQSSSHTWHIHPIRRLWRLESHFEQIALTAKNESLGQLDFESGACVIESSRNELRVILTDWLGMGTAINGDIYLDTSHQIQNARISVISDSPNLRKLIPKSFLTDIAPNEPLPLLIRYEKGVLEIAVGDKLFFRSQWAFKKASRTEP